MLQIRRGWLPNTFIPERSIERVLLCGWRRDIEDMIMVTVCSGPAQDGFLKHIVVDWL